MSERLPKDTLTPRERRTVELVAQGWSTREIAARFGVSSQAVRNYIWRACEKIGASNRVELAMFTLHGAGPQKAARQAAGKESAA
jgi:DNA-binding NarL/FixJ family response regulator